MHKWNKRIVTLGFSCLLLGLALGGIGSALGGLENAEKWDKRRLYYSPIYEEKIGQISHINANLDLMNLSIVESQNDSKDFVLTYAKPQNGDLSYQVKGGRLHLTESYEGGKIVHYSGFDALFSLTGKRPLRPLAEVTLTVPKGTKLEELKAVCTFNSFSLEGVSVKHLNLQLENFTTKIKNATIEHANISSEYSALSVLNSQLSQLSLTMNDGELFFEDSQLTDSTLSIENGTVDGNLTSLNGKIDMTLEDGDVILNLTPNSFKTTSFDLSSENESIHLQGKAVGNHYVEQKQAEQAKLTIRSENGRITLR